MVETWRVFARGYCDRPLPLASSLSKGCPSVRPELVETCSPSVRIEPVEMLVVLEAAVDLKFRGRGLPDGKSLYLLRQIK